MACFEGWPLDRAFVRAGGCELAWVWVRVRMLRCQLVAVAAASLWQCCATCERWRCRMRCRWLGFRDAHDTRHAPLDLFERLKRDTATACKAVSHTQSAFFRHERCCYD